jgi:hypothetical protein
VVAEQLLGRMTVGVQARAQKPVDLGAVLGGAERAQLSRRTSFEEAAMTVRTRG